MRETAIHNRYTVLLAACDRFSVGLWSPIHTVEQGLFIYVRKYLVEVFLPKRFYELRFRS
jgi:hypothetical protein